MVNHRFSSPFGIMFFELFPSSEDSQIQVLGRFGSVAPWCSQKDGWTLEGGK